MNTQIEILNIDLTKESINRISSEIVLDVINGNLSALDTKIKFKALEKVIKQVCEQIDSIARNEAEKYGKSFERLGAKVECIEAGITFNYSACGDPVYNELSAAVDYAKEKLEERKAFLKTVKAEFPIVIPATGECVTIYPPIKTSTSTIKVTI